MIIPKKTNPKIKLIVILFQPIIFPSILQICEGGSVVDLVQELQDKTRRMAEEHIAFILKEAVKVSPFLYP